MSEKKPHNSDCWCNKCFNGEEQALENPPSIEIITVGVRNSNAEIILKDHHPAPIPVPSPAQPPEEVLPEIEAQVSHTNLGDK
jgi:hypothetical protein